MARGLGDSYGLRTEYDPNRGVSREALPQSVASTLHYQQGRSAQDVEAMSPEEWEGYSRNGLVDQGRVIDQLRAMENYQPGDGTSQ